jgi:hypothetical protein
MFRRFPMPEATRDDAARARLQGKRAVLGVILVVSLVVIGSSSLEIIPAVFGAGIRPIPAAPPGSSARICADGVRKLERALDRAVDSAGSASFPARLEPEWADAATVSQACGQSSEGIDAWAALARLRSAEEQLSPRAGAELEPLRRDVIAHLPADLR